MENPTKSYTGKIVIATTIGIAIGTILGILIAPHKGSKTREKLFKKANGIKSVIKHKFNGEKYAEVQKDFIKRPPLI